MRDGPAHMNSEWGLDAGSAEMDVQQSVDRQPGRHRDLPARWKRAGDPVDVPATHAPRARREKPLPLA